MIIISNSIVKTGSTLLVGYQADLIRDCGEGGGQSQLRSLFNGRFIQKPSIGTLLKLAKCEKLHGTCVVKCHWRPGLVLDWFCRANPVKMTVAYRDPRDIILSMIDHGKRTRARPDSDGPFSDCYTVESLVPRVVKLMEQVKHWERRSFVKLVRYENMMADPVGEVMGVARFLDFGASEEVVKKIVDERERRKATSRNFNKGIVNRWREEMSQDQKDLCREAFGEFLDHSNYDVA